MRKSLLVALALGTLACSGLPSVEPAVARSPEERYRAWREERGKPDRPVENDGSLGEFQFFCVSGSRGQGVDRVAVSPTTMLNAGMPGDWRALLRSGDAEDVHVWVAWLKRLNPVEAGDLAAKRPPLAPYYTPPTLVTEGEITRLVGWYQEYPSDTSTRLTLVTGPNNEAEFTYEALEDLMAEAQ